MNEAPNRPEWLWSLESVFQFLEQADEAIALPINTENGEEVAERLAELIAMFPASCNVVAACKWYEQAAYKQEFHMYAEELKSRAGETFRHLTAASVLRDYLKSRTAEVQALYTRAERTNAAITHAMEGLRSILSKIKEDKKISNYAANLR
jgi:hypothetical protein